MKVTLLLITLITINCSHFNFDEQFELFLQKYNKTYLGDELKDRRQIFTDNWTNIQALQFSDSERYADFGMSPFLDMTREEFKQKYLTLKVQGEFDFHCSAAMKTEGVEPKESFDWREVDGVVTSVKNQGPCGSCWAFSTIGNLEGRYKLVYNENALFSEQMLVDCSQQNGGCEGGLMDLAFEDLSSMKLISADDYPYFATGGVCKADSLPGLDIVGGCVYADTQEEDEIAKMLQKYGPLSVALDAEWLQYYWGGIHDPYFCNDSINHAVVLVGFGEENGKKYWIIKNSWSSQWGEMGYFRLARGSGACHINKFIVSGVFKGEN